MKAEWNVLRKPGGMNVPAWEHERTPEMQRRRELAMLHQEAALQMHLPMYGVLSIDALADPEDVRELTNVLPEARAAVLLGVSIDDPWQRLWQRVTGISMREFATVATSSLEIALLRFRDILEMEGYTAVVKQLPLTPTNRHTRLFELAGAGFVGKNHLVITEQHGCRVNLGVIVTDAPLLHGDYRYPAFRENLCGDCTLCEDYCPSEALKGGRYDQARCEAYCENSDHQFALGSLHVQVRRLHARLPPWKRWKVGFRAGKMDQGAGGETD